MSKWQGHTRYDSGRFEGIDVLFSRFLQQFHFVRLLLKPPAVQPFRLLHKIERHLGCKSGC